MSPGYAATAPVRAIERTAATISRSLTWALDTPPPLDLLCGLLGLVLEVVEGAAAGGGGRTPRVSSPSGRRYHRIWRWWRAPPPDLEVVVEGAATGEKSVCHCRGIRPRTPLRKEVVHRTCSHFSEAVVEVAIFQTNHNSTLGIDGLPTEFY